MKKLIAICLVCIAFMTAAASGNYILSFDENGNGSYVVDGNSPIPLEYGVNEIPTNPWATLYYKLPFQPAYLGDLVVMEPGTSTISDVLRFIDARVYVFSDLPEAGESPELADTGIPPDLLLSVVYMDEVGTEGGWNGVIYQPASGQPGWSDSGIGSITYNFTSDIPEPATIGLLSLGALSLLRRKQ